jgi:hypothetical protein
MNFKDLLEKMAELDTSAEDKYLSQDDNEVQEGGMTPADTEAETPLMGEEGVDECGGMMSPMSSMASKQPDNVTMNVSMNGSGSGGIKDLLDILRNIEKPSMGDKDADAVLVGMEEFANQPDAQTAGIDAVTPTGDDLFSKGAEAEKVNGGGNPMQPGVSESLIAQLNNLYQEVKERRTDETMFDRPALRKASDEADFQQRMQQTVQANAADKARRAQELVDNNIRLRLAKIGQLKSFKPGMTDQEVSAMELAHKQKYGM